MQPLYEKLEREGKIGPFTMRNGQLEARPLLEYPKWVTTAEGKRVIVQDLTEEARVAGEPTALGAPDPLSDARAKLAEQSDKLDKERSELEELKAQMKASLAELETARAGIQAQGQGAQAKAEPVKGPTERPQGSTFRLPKTDPGPKGSSE